VALIHRFEKLLDQLTEGFTWLAGLLLLFALIMVCIDVFLRYFFNSPVGWVLQMCEYTLLYIPFLGASIVLKEDQHIRIDILLNQLNPYKRSLINVVTSFLGFCVLSVLTYYGAYVTIDYYHRNVPTINYLKIPEFLVIMIIPIGCFVFALQFLRAAKKAYDFLRREDKESEGLNGGHHNEERTF
jgi:TRAP-type C4-dicarboxylate transport system permease small subunit